MVKFSDNTMYIASVVATYWFVSISMVYLNKILMSSEGVSINAPLFITWYQCVVTILVCYMAGKISQRLLFQAAAANNNNNTSLLPMMNHNTTTMDESASGAEMRKGHHHSNKKSFFSQFPLAQYNVSIGMKVMPLSIIFVGMIAFNNLCLKYVEVSFYNVARSLTIVFNVILSKILLNSHTSFPTMICLGIVIIGFFMGAKGEVHFDFTGTMFGIGSSLFVSLNSIYTKKVLPVVDNDHWKLTYYNNVNAVLLFVPLMLYYETPVLIQAMHQQLLSISFWLVMSVTGIMGFSIGIVTVLQIKATSPLSHNISGTAKAAFQSMLAFYIWKNPATVMGVAGMFVVLGGSLMYTIVKMREGSPSSKPKKLEVTGSSNTTTSGNTNTGSSNNSNTLSSTNNTITAMPTKQQDA